MTAIATAAIVPNPAGARRPRPSLRLTGHEAAPDGAGSRWWPSA